jgi:hypothetical protein
VTTQRIQASSLMSWLAEWLPSELRDKLDSGPSCFRGMYLSEAKLFWNWVFSRSFLSSSSCRLNENIAFRVGFFPILLSLQSFSSEVFGMTTRRDSAALIGIILAFEW